MAGPKVKMGMGAVPAVLGGILTGTVVGTLHGFWFTRFRIPSFVVTLAGLLAWFGLQLRVLGETGTINIYDPRIDQLAGQFFPAEFGWVLAAAVVVLLTVNLVVRRRGPASAGAGGKRAVGRRRGAPSVRGP